MYQLSINSLMYERLSKVGLRQWAVSLSRGNSFRAWASARGDAKGEIGRVVSTSTRYYMIVISLIIGFSLLCAAVAFMIIASFRTVDYGFFGMLQGRFVIVVIVVVVVAGVLVAYALSDSLRKILRKMNANARRTEGELCERGHG